jgi:hypothetical protein
MAVGIHPRRIVNLESSHECLEPDLNLNIWLFLNQRVPATGYEFIESILFVTDPMRVITFV